MKILVAGVVLAAVLAVAPRAHADDLTHDAALFCRLVDSDPTPQGVMRAVNEFGIQGVPTNLATDTVIYALNELCPEYWDEVESAYNTYGSKGIAT